MIRDNMPRRRVAFLDLEGTLLKGRYRVHGHNVHSSQWPAVAELLGPQAIEAERETQLRWNEGGYPGYVEWVRDTCEIHRRYGLTKNQLTELVASAELMPGAETLVSSLHRHGLSTAILTGGIKQFADRVQRELRIHHSLAACEYFFGKDGSLDYWNILPSDFLGKSRFMQVLIREHGALSADCVFIGDGDNDIELARAVGFSVSFNGSPALEAVASQNIRQPPGEEDLGAAVRLIEEFLSLGERN